MWWDNWTGKGPLSTLYGDINTNPKVHVKEYIQNGEWNRNKLGSIFSEETMEYIMKINIGD